MTLRETVDKLDEKMRDEAVNLLRKQIDVERILVNLYSKTVERLQNPAVKHILHSIQLDSVKHIDICQTAVDILLGEELARDEKTQISEELEEHIQLEKDSINRAKQIMKIQIINENKGVERLVKDLFDDEKRHHKMLLRLISKPFYRVDPNDFGFMLLGEELIRRRQEKGLRTGTPKKTV